MNSHLNSRFFILNDIDCTDYDFLPIGSSAVPFSGSLSGGNHKILNLVLKYPPTYPGIGLFGYTNGATISQLVLINVSVYGGAPLGALIGSASYSVISDVHVQGEVSAPQCGQTSNYVGGLIGNAIGIQIANCSTLTLVRGPQTCAGTSIGGLVGYLSSLSRSSLVSSFALGPVNSDGYVGGLVGMGYYCSISDCYTTGAVTSRAYGGGLAAVISSSSVNRCYSTGKVIGISVGGLVATTSNSSISDSYSESSVGGSQYVGGLIGYNSGAFLKLSVTNSLARGLVSGLYSNTTGGLLGYIDRNPNVTITNSYWDKETTQQNISAGGGVSKTSQELYQQVTYIGWDFINVWNIIDKVSYPWLRSPEEDIQTCDQLQHIPNNLNGIYKLVTNIDCTNYNFIPIGTYNLPFSGVLEGNEYRIVNLTINQPGQPYIGLFGVTNGAEINNLVLTKINIVGDNVTGGLIGYALNTQLFNIVADGRVVGSNTTTTYEYAGGLVGILSGSSRIDHSVAAITVNAPSCSYVGGFVGQSNSHISNSYSLSVVTGFAYVGGLVGENLGLIKNTYSIGKINAILNETVGGLVAIESGSVVSSYWDIQTSGLTTSAAGIGKMTNEMYQQNTYQNWDFINIWSIFDGFTYPWLQTP